MWASIPWILSGSLGRPVLGFLFRLSVLSLSLCIFCPLRIRTLLSHALFYLHIRILDICRLLSRRLSIRVIFDRRLRLCALVFSCISRWLSSGFRYIRTLGLASILTTVFTLVPAVGLRCYGQFFCKKIFVHVLRSKAACRFQSIFLDDFAALSYRAGY